MEKECDKLRVEIEGIKVKTRNLMDDSMFQAAAGGEVLDGADYGEMKANIMLVFRHLEDARMRLGKVIQAMRGGTSVYDKKPEAPVDSPTGHDSDN